MLSAYLLLAPELPPRASGKERCLHEFYSQDKENFKKIDLSPRPPCSDGPELHLAIGLKFDGILLKILSFWNMKEMWNMLKSNPKKTV